MGKDEYLNQPHIPKEQLRDGAHYKGDCRNASIARWNAKTERFYYERFKVFETFVEDICCPEDDDGSDLFFAHEEVEVDTPVPRLPEEC